MLDNLKNHNFSWTHRRTEDTGQTTSLKSKEGQALPGEMGCEHYLPGVDARHINYKQNTANIFEELLKAAWASMKVENS